MEITLQNIWFLITYCFFCVYLSYTRFLRSSICKGANPHLMGPIETITIVLRPLSLLLFRLPSICNKCSVFRRTQMFGFTVYPKPSLKTASVLWRRMAWCGRLFQRHVLTICNISIFFKETGFPTQRAMNAKFLSSLHVRCHTEQNICFMPTAVNILVF